LTIDSSFNGHTAVEDFVAVNIISVQIMDELDRRNLWTLEWQEYLMSSSLERPLSSRCKMNIKANQGMEWAVCPKVCL